MKLRTGRENGRTIYIQRGDEPAKTDPMVATADTAPLAARLVEAFNQVNPDADTWFATQIVIYGLDVFRQAPND